MKPSAPMPRFVSRSGMFNIIRKGESQFDWSDLYHLFLTLSWLGFFGLIGLLYITTNAFFALVYLAGGDCIGNAQPGSFIDAFFFSVQTIATIGYGGMYPRTTYANLVVTIEALIGLIGVAMVTGLAFARFSRPTARVLFSNVAVIAPYNGVPTLMFRAANQRHNQILEAQIRLTMARNEVTTEGHFMRRLHDIKLIRSRTPIFALTWTVMHALNETSPLYGVTPEELAESQTELIITVIGIDTTVSQTVHARHSYIAEEILWDTEFVDILSLAPNGRRVIDYTRFHEVKHY